MKFILFVLWSLEATIVLALPFKKSTADVSALRRKTRSTDGHIGCIHMESFPGELQYTSDGTTADVCGLYLIGQPDQIVQIEFVDFNVRCETGGLLAIFDGWELQGELFPDMYDHTQSMQERYTQFCNEGPKKIFVSSQNVALIQFLIPQAGEGFKVYVTFKPNPQPCNAVAMFEMGVLTMKNYGLKRNCTTSIIYPEKIQLLNVDVGVTSERKRMEVEVGLTDKQCMNFGGGDYIQLMNGNGLETSLMSTRRVFCGMESNSDKNVNVVLGCQHSVVRMVSSGEYYNTVTFKYTPPQEEDLGETTTAC